MSLILLVACSCARGSTTQNYLSANGNQKNIAPISSTSGSSTGSATGSTNTGPGVAPVTPPPDNATTPSPNTTTPIPSSPVGFAAPASPWVSLRGRIDVTTNPNMARMAWAGTAIGARFSGQSLSVAVVEESLTGSYVGNDSFDVVIDNGNSVVVEASFTPTTTVVATNLSSGTHTVWLVKRTDPSVGAADFLGFTVSAGGTFLSPPAPLPHSIEFVGASELAGFGVYTTGDLCDGLHADSDDALFSYPQMAGALLQAQVSSYVYCGKALLKNVSPQDTVKTLPYMYQRIIPDDPNTPLWNFSKTPSDVVVVDAGGVDFISNPNLDLNTFTQAYYNFIRQIRGLNPNATIICSRDALDGNNYSDFYTQGIQAAVAQNNSANNDANVIYFPFPQYAAADGLGCISHPSIAGATHMAQNIAAAIQQRMGW